VYVMSLVFLLASVISLLLGLGRGGLTLIFASIGFSVLAALFLAASVLRRASEAPVEERRSESRVDEWRGEPSLVHRSSEQRDAASFEEREGGPLARESVVGIVDRPLAGRHREGRQPSAVSAPEGTEAAVLGPDVVATSDLGTYHRPSCEHARGRASTDRLKRAVAKRLGYTPCGVCRPG
jgi:hypothetical protein